MPSRSLERGFMEPIKHATYYEDVYTKTTNEDDFTEARTFDLCEDSSEDEQNQSRTKHTRKNTQHTTSYGSVKKPTYKPRIERTQQPAYKIAPSHNAKHSIRLSIEESDEDEHLNRHTNHSNPLLASTELSTQAFAAEKAWQHQLSGTALFENIRRQRAADRLRLHHACQQARKTKERALRDVETAAACLVDDVPTRDFHIHIDIDSSEVPTDFIDLTREGARRKEKKKLADKSWPPKNWKGQEMDLATGAAYVLIMDREQGVA